MTKKLLLVVLFSFLPALKTAHALSALQVVAYIADLGSDSVSILDTSTDTITATVEVGTDPEGVAVDENLGEVFIVNNGSDDVSVIDMSTNTVTATIEVGTDPIGVAVTPDGLETYVANSGDDDISVINTEIHSRIRDVLVGKHPHPIGDFIGTIPLSSGGSNDCILTLTRQHTARPPYTMLGFLFMTPLLWLIVVRRKTLKLQVFF